MSRENKFQNLITSQNNNRKEKVWDNLKDSLNNPAPNEMFQENGNTVAVSRKKLFIPIISAVILLCVVSLILGLTLKPAVPDGGPRYCAESDYSICRANMTLDEYARENNLELLTFGWNEETEAYYAEIFTLKNSDEIICFMETSVDERTGCSLKFSVTDNNTTIEFLKTFESLDRTYQVNGLTVKWSYGVTESSAMFEYKSYRYYISLSDSEEEDAVLYWVDKLING